LLRARKGRRQFLPVNVDARLDVNLSPETWSAKSPVRAMTLAGEIELSVKGGGGVGVGVGGTVSTGLAGVVVFTGATWKAKILRPGSGTL
jgi:hypothetical protein